MGHTILLSGQPGVGKTTLIKKLVVALPGKCGGFYTQEIRARGIRVGFEIVTLDGRRAALASAGVPSLPRVGKYGVHVQNVDGLAVPAIYGAIAEADVVVIDEIGKMELFSDAFRTAVLAAVRSPKRVLATVMWRASPWTDALKSEPGVILLEVTLANRGSLLSRVLQALV
jgi:nucleoside-triphosphatase THEP1